MVEVQQYREISRKRSQKAEDYTCAVRVSWFIRERKPRKLSSKLRELGKAKMRLAPGHGHNDSPKGNGNETCHSQTSIPFFQREGVLNMYVQDVAHECHGQAAEGRSIPRSTLKIMRTKRRADCPRKYGAKLDMGGLRWGVGNAGWRAAEVSRMSGAISCVVNFIGGGGGFNLLEKCTRWQLNSRRQCVSRTILFTEVVERANTLVSTLACRSVDSSWRRGAHGSSRVYPYTLSMKY